MKRVETKGMSCWCDSLRLVGYNAALLSLFGNRNAVRAAWAVFFDRRRWPSLEIGESHVSRLEDTAYSSIHTPLGKGLLHTLIVCSAATHQHSAFEDYFLQVGPDAETRFFDRLSRTCPVPMRPTWRDAIWDLGLATEAIEPLSGFGLPMFRISTDKKTWAPIIKDALTSGTLS